MFRWYDGEATGCLTWMAAYCLGSWLMAPLLDHNLGSESNIAQAPLNLPALFALGLYWAMLGAVPLFYLAMVACWLGLIVAASGLIGIVTQADPHWWPFAWIAAIYALALIPNWL